MVVDIGGASVDKRRICCNFLKASIESLRLIILMSFGAGMLVDAFSSATFASRGGGEAGF